MERFVFLICFLLAGNVALASNLPRAFDLRNVAGSNFVSAIKSQSGGTCWTHGTIASLESNLMMTGAWQKAGEAGEPALAEYHLDWWNGFNSHFNADIAPATGGLTVHEGGDYRVAAAYFARGGGAVRKVDGQSFDTAPDQTKASYHYYYPRDIDWLTVGNDSSQLDSVKQALATNGAVGTALDWDENYYSDTQNTFYQPASSTGEPNHAVTIVGWDDTKTTQASQPGAWLVKNSWGADWGEGGFFWLSYYDKTSGKHPQMGAVSFNHVEPMHYSQIYYHDYHGWRDTKTNVTEAFNAFVAKGNRAGRETLQSVSFYAAADNVNYTVRIFGRFDGGQLQDELTAKSGQITHSGFHTVDLDYPIALHAAEKFYVYLQLSAGGQPFDRTSEVPVLLGRRYRTIVVSTAHAGESYYRSGSSWVDLTQDDKSANFCMKALSVFD